MQVKEKVAPVITVTSPTSGQLTSQAKPEFSWEITDNDSGVNPSTIGITIDSGAKISGDEITKTPTTNGYKCQYTPKTALSDGEHTVKLDASDNDGNAATPKSVTFRVLATAPNLSITSPTEGGWAKTPTINFSGTTDATTLTVKVGSGSEKDVTISGGSFNGTVTLTNEGDNIITFVAANAAGVKTTVTRTVKLDTHAPVILSTSITPNPVDAGQTYVISVEVTD